MAQIIKKCPVFILAFVVAMALTLTMGLSAQKAYAGSEDEYDPKIVFHYDEYGTFYEDGEYVIPYEIANAPEQYELDFKMGFIVDPDDDESYAWDHGWSKVFTESEGYYSVDRDAQVITMHGPKIWEAVEQYIPENVYLEGAPIMLATQLNYDLDREPVYEWDWINIHPIDTNYDIDDYDGKMLVGTSDMFSTIDGVIYNSDAQSGKHMHFDVVNLTTSDESIVKVTEDNGDWAYEGVAKGKATLTVTFENYFGEEQSFTCTKTVVDEMLEVDIEPVDGYTEVLPGQSIALKAYAYHDIVTDEGIQEGKITGYTWSLSKKDKKYASVTKNKKDPSQATLKFKSSAKNKRVLVWVKVTAKGKSGAKISAKSCCLLRTSTEFYQLSPGAIPGDLKVGETYTLTPKVMEYTTKKPKGVEVKDVTFEYEFYEDADRDCLEITSNADKTEFYIKRLTADEAGFDLSAREGEYVLDTVNYWLDDVHYDLGSCNVLVNGEEWNTYTVNGKDSELSPDDMNISLVDENGEVVPKDAYALKFSRTLGFNHDEEQWEETLPPLTIAGTDKEQGFSEYRVIAETIDEDISLGETAPSYFVLFDTHSLSFVGAEANFGAAFSEQNANEWPSFYNVPFSEIKTPVVYALNQEVVPADQYTLTYYKRPKGEFVPYDVIDSEPPLEGMPSDIGAYIVHIQAKDGADYYGQTLTYFNIGPDGTSITKLAKAKKAFTVKWQKQTNPMPTDQITGYEIEYSTDQNFESSKTKTVKGASKASVKISKLKAKKKYFVQIRTYITVDGVDYYSPWSEVKTVKTK
ncbi:MAG: fibronectin type III domain-containing protein [Bacillota bacterium]|nr:fibronectin type III domain-containing protein [Bacillota bacterium]